MVNSNHGTANHYAMSRAIRAVVCVLVLLHRYIILFTAAKALFEVRLSKLFILMCVLMKSLVMAFKTYRKYTYL